MSREKKAQDIEQLLEKFTTCDIGIFTDYRGMSTAQLTVLRAKLRSLGVEYRVAKNTMSRFAAERAGRGDLVDFFTGPIAIAVGYGDITEPAKALASFINAEKVSLTIKGGFLRDSMLTAEDVEVLAKLPSREVLLGKFVGGLQSPITLLVNSLASPIRGLIGGLQARIQQLEGA